MGKAFVRVSFVLCSVALLLLGCGGGGGGGSSAVPPFVKWSAVAPPTTITVGGISQEMSYTAPAPTYNLTSYTNKGVSTSSSATIKYRADGSIERLSISTPYTSVAWDATAGDTIAADSTGVLLTMIDPSADKFGITVIPQAIGWDYQTFGIWRNRSGTGSGTWGEFTGGAPTAGSAIPASGNATFVGGTLGIYSDASGTNQYLTTSDITLNANFLSRTLNLSTTGTFKTTTSGVQSAASNLNMTGTLSYTVGTNYFTGPVTATGLTGTSAGQFYGPSAQELGGVFKLTGAGLELYRGSYGANR